MKKFLLSLLAAVGTVASAQTQTSNTVTWDNIHLIRRQQPQPQPTINVVTWDNLHLQQPRVPALATTLGPNVAASTNSVTTNAAPSWDTIHLRQQPTPPHPVLGGWDFTPPIPYYGNGLGNGKEWHRGYLGGLLSIQGVFVLNTQQRSGPNWVLVPTYPGRVIQFGGSSGGSGSWDNVSPSRQAPTTSAPGGWDIVPTPRAPASTVPGGWDTMGRK